jgi:GH18 family chitinase
MRLFFAKKHFIILFAGFIFASFIALGEESKDGIETTSSKKSEKDITSERVVVYYPWWSWDKWTDRKSDLDKITHINIAFANPDKDGNLLIKNFDGKKLLNTSRRSPFQGSQSLDFNRRRGWTGLFKSPEL